MASRRAAGLAVRSAAALIRRNGGYQAASSTALQHRGIAAAACRSALHGIPGGSIRPNSQYDSLAFPKQCSMLQPSRSFASGDLPPHQEIGMPSLSPTMTQGNIAKWRKKEGDKVIPGDVLCEIETDKATLEMESMEEGFLAKILVGDGAKDIKVGQPICIVVEDQGDVSKFSSYQGGSGGGGGGGGGSAPPKAPPKSDSPKAQSRPESRPPPASTAPPSRSEVPRAPSSASSGGRVFASPAARKLAEDKSVSLASIKGTGPDGRIVRADVEDLLASGPSPSRGTPSHSAAPASAGDLDFTDLPNTQIRKVIAQRLLLSKQTIPHYYLSVDTRVDRLNAVRNKLNAALEAVKGKKLSINDFVIKAAALALRKVPECNSSWTDEYIRQYRNVNISIAVQTDFGLMVPVIKDADKRGLLSISEDVKALAEKAKKNGLKPADYEGGTFTVSNLGGPFGIKHFCAIINPPQSCILAVGSAEKRVIPGKEPGEFAAGSFMTVTLSCDHRVVDGAVGAQWLGAFKGFIEDPDTLLL